MERKEDFNLCQFLAQALGFVCKSRVVFGSTYYKRETGPRQDVEDADAVALAEDGHQI
jgi:hypothetical protein